MKPIERQKLTVMLMISLVIAGQPLEIVNRERVEDQEKRQMDKHKVNKKEKEWEREREREREK